jgi:hypothetical protein
MRARKCLSVASPRDRLMKNTYTAIASTCALTIVGVLLVVYGDAREVSVSEQSKIDYEYEG